MFDSRAVNFMICSFRPTTIALFLGRKQAARARASVLCTMAVAEKITPNEREAKLFAILTGTLSHGNLSSVLRCAGGWVRDKLLGLDSVDIDIAIDNMLGREFAEHVNRYLESQKLDARKVAVITSNPEQSKHLETARMQLDNLELDLVNLRSETYTDSRIPEMTFGTPTQDAERRDFTVNSLFYNLNTSQVEDFTAKGLEDLREGIIRTPLAARQTFLDDPLRVLRGLRFAARFNFKLDTTFQEAAATTEVQSALAKKVSRERMGSELEKMFSGRGPVASMRDMVRLQLLSAVFAVPKDTQPQLRSSWGASGVDIMEAAQQLLAEWEPQDTAFSKEEQRLGLMAAFLLPLRHLTVPAKGKKEQPLSSHLITSSIKWRGSDAACIENLHTEAAQLHQAYQLLRESSHADDAGVDLRLKLGRSLRSLKADRWRLGILMAPLVAMPAASAAVMDPGDTPEQPERGSPGSADLESGEARLECVRQLSAAISALELEGCWDWKPLLDGREIMQLLGVKGKAVGQLSAALVDFQLANPHAGREQAEIFLRQRQAEGC